MVTQTRTYVLNSTFEWVMSQNFNVEQLTITLTMSRVTAQWAKIRSAGGFFMGSPKKLRCNALRSQLKINRFLKSIPPRPSKIVSSLHLHHHAASTALATSSTRRPISRCNSRRYFPHTHAAYPRRRCLSLIARFIQ